MGIPFKAEDWLNQAVRTSLYHLPDSPPYYGDLDASPDDLAKSLSLVTGHVADRSSAKHALLPPRIPMDVPLPDAWKTLEGFEKTVNALISQKGGMVHPAVFHALLSVAIGREGDTRDAWIDAVAPAFKKTHHHQMYWQPTITQASWLRPKWFSPVTTVTPSIRGGETTEGRGTLTSLNILMGKMRINAAHMLTYPGVTTRENALYPDTLPHWSAMAEKAFFGPNPLTTSLWLLGLMEDKKHAWDRLNPGAAIWSPTYTNGEIDALAANAVTYCKPGYVFRPGAGISDIYPYKDDPVLASMMNMIHLLDAPFSYSTWVTLKNLSDHPGCPVGMTEEWAKMQSSRIEIIRLMGMTPPGSAFSSAGETAITFTDISSDGFKRISKLGKNWSLAALTDMGVSGPNPDNMRMLSQAMNELQKHNPEDSGLASGLFASTYIPFDKVVAREKNQVPLSVMPVFSATELCV